MTDRLKGIFGMSQFSTILIGILFLAFFTLVSIISVLVFNVSNPATTITTIIGFVTLIMTQLLGMMKQEQEIQKTRHDLRNEINTVSVKADVAARVVEQHEQNAEKRMETISKIRDEAECLPKTKSEFETMVRDIVRTTADTYVRELRPMIVEVATQTAKMVAEKTAAEVAKHTAKTTADHTARRVVEEMVGGKKTE